MSAHRAEPWALLHGADERWLLNRFFIFVAELAERFFR
jgi:hypothetical protein